MYQEEAMMKRKWLLIAVAALAVATTLPAQAKSQPREVKFWTLFTGGDGEFFDAMVKAYNASQTDVVMKNDTVKYTDYYTKLTAALAAKTAPDVVVCHASNLVNYVPNNVFLPLDSYIKQAGVNLSDFEPASLKGVTFNGKIYALPLDVHPLIMYVNVDLLKKAGIDKIPSTYDEVLADAKIVQDKTGAIGIACDDTTATYKAYTFTRVFMSYLKQQGQTILTADNKKANFNNDSGVKAYQLLCDMVNKNAVTPKGLDYDSSVADFKLGKAAFHFNGVWCTGSFEEQKDLNFVAVPFPAAFGANASWTDSHTFAVPVQKRLDQQKVLDVVKFMDWMTSHGEMWAKAGHIPTRISVVAKPEFQGLAHRKDYAAAVKYVFTPPATPKWGQIYDLVSDCLEAAVAKNADAKTTLADMEKKVNAVLAR
jgi:multiple sugar transport system substrate-binding protein